MNQPPLPPPFPPPQLPARPASNIGIIILIVAGCVVALIVGLALVAALVVPQMSAALTRGQATATLNNARQIHIANMRMAVDNEVSLDPALGWPGDLAKSRTRPIVSVGDYVERLVEYKYIDRGDLKIFQAPGMPAYPGTGPFDASYSAFKVYKVGAKDADDCLFLATRNFTFGTGLDAHAVPYGSKIGVICHKDGSCQIVTPKQAATTDIGRMPGGANRTNTSAEKPEDILKM